MPDRDERIREITQKFATGEIQGEEFQRLLDEILGEDA